MSKQLATAQQLLPLPYEPIQVASRDIVRQSSLRGGRETVYVLLSNVIIRPGFNIREQPAGMSDEDWYKELKIEELALNMLVNGMERPIEGIFNTQGFFVLMEGQRRYLAVLWLITAGHQTQPNGKPWEQIEVIQIPKETSEDQWILKMLNSNDNLKYKPIEIANGMLRLKRSFGYSNHQIAEKLGKSRQYIDNLISLAEEPESIKHAVATGQITPTAALEVKRKIPNQEEREDFIKDKLDKGEEVKVKDAQNLVKEGETSGTGADQQVPRDETFVDPANQTKVETKASLKAEEQSRQTSSKAKTQPPRTGKDALPPVDWSEDKTEAELELNEVMKLLDKLEVKAGFLPDHLKQYKDEYAGLINFIKGKITNVQKLVKKAPVRAGEEE